MVSKRRSNSEVEPGPSKKRVRATEKQKPELEEVTTPDKKKRVRKSKSTKETSETASALDYDNELAVKVEIPEDIDLEDLVSKKAKNLASNSDMPNWPVEHMGELLRRIENNLPEKDTLQYKSRVDKLDWNNIAFENYSGTDCRLMWDSIQKRVRRYRTLGDLLHDAKSWLLKPWTNFYRSSKLNRHPDMPRRPLSSYMIFYLKKKDKVLEEHPGLEMTDLSRLIADRYNKLTPKAKEKYNALAAIHKQKYVEQLEEFCRLHPTLVQRSTKAATNDLAPQKPKTPFKLFCEDKLKRTENDEDFEKGTFLENCKAQWRTMSLKKKVFWINWALDKEAKFHEDLKKYIAENPDYVPVLPRSVLTKEEQVLRERMAGKPVKPPTSSYSLFSRLMLASEDVKSVSPKERMLVIARQWKNCTEEEKKDYQDRAKHMLEQYKLQYAEYLESLPEDKRQEELLKSQPKKRTKVTKQSKVPKPGAPAELGNNKRAQKGTKVKTLKKKAGKDDSPKSMSKKDSNLYEGEPEPPPATPYLLFVKSYQSSYPDRQNAHEVWESMNEEQRNFHRRVLWDLKKVYIESYENFLKGLTQEELKEYSEWKKTAKMAIQDSESTSDESGSDSDQECSSNSDSDGDDDVDDKPAGVKSEAPDGSSSSE